MSLSVPTRQQTGPALAAMTRGFVRAALDFIYPPQCLLCESDDIRHRASLAGLPAFCDECHEKLVPAVGNECRKCGAPLGPFTNSDAGCPLCRREHFAFDEVIRLGLYRDELRVACLKAKNPAGALLGRALIDLLVDVKAASFAAQPIAAIVPVPEHWLKRIVRPQYAAETLARQLSHRLKLRLATGILAKPRWTPKQAKSPPTQRRQQQRGAFQANLGVDLRGRTVLLVDDILTTGATADAAARALKQAGAKRVVVSVLAVSPPTA